MRARFTTAVPLRMWKAEVWVDGVPNGDGVIINRDDVLILCHNLNGANLANVICDKPTLENLTVWMIEQVKAMVHEDSKVLVRVYEDEDCSCQGGR